MNKRGTELSVNLLIKILLVLLVLVVLMLIFLSIGGEGFSGLRQQMSNAIASLTGLELFK
tara:strand:- start:130 stop:309 length:180 start_codon:yes stop_codon:yes gene_type:complete